VDRGKSGYYKADSKNQHEGFDDVRLATHFYSSSNAVGKLSENQ